MTREIDEIDTRAKAPTRSELADIDDIGVLHDMLSDCMDQVISIETHLEYLLEDYHDKHRAVTALIHWRRCAKNIKNRLNVITAERSRSKKESG